VRARTALLAVALVLLAGCDDDAATVPAPQPTFTPPVTATAAPRTAPPTVAPVLTPSTPPSPTPLTGPVLVLAGDGLGLAAAQGARITPIPFGAPASTVLPAVEDALGTPPGRTSLPDCGQGARTSVGFGGFSVLLDGATFVGWTERGSSARLLTSADGLGLRSRLRDIRAARADVHVTAGSLGTEAVLPDGLALLLDGPFDRSQVTSLSGGETCFAR
jgi:hypothetical protein